MMLALFIIVPQIVCLHVDRQVDNSVRATHSIIRSEESLGSKPPGGTGENVVTEPEEVVLRPHLNQQPNLKSDALPGDAQAIKNLTMRHEFAGLAIAIAVCATGYVGWRYQFGVVKGKQLHARTGAEYASHHPEMDKLIEAGGEEIGKMGVKGLVFTLVTAMVGAGVLTFPGVMKECGWNVGPFVILAGGMCNLAPSLIFRDVMDTVGTCSQYRDVVAKVFGERGGLFAEFMIQGFIFGITGIYIVLIGEMLDFLVPWSTRGWILATGGLMIPSSFVKDVSMLAKLSAIGVLASLLYVICIAGGGIQAANTYKATDRPHGNHWPEGFMSVITNLSISFFGYQAVHMLPALKKDLEQPEKLGQSITCAVFIVMGIYLVVGSVGYYGWGNNVEGLILNSMCENPGCKDGGARMEFGFTLAGAVVANLAVSLPMLLFVFFQSLETRFSSLQTSWALNGGTRVSVIVVATMVAVFTPYFKELLSIFSSSFGVAIGLLVPALCSIKLHRDAGKRVRVDAVLVLLLGLGLFVLGVYGGIVDLLNAINPLPLKDGKAPAIPGFWDSKWTTKPESAVVDK